jgi:hypothetical protein
MKNIEEQGTVSSVLKIQNSKTNETIPCSFTIGKKSTTGTIFGKLLISRKGNIYSGPSLNKHSL